MFVKVLSATTVGLDGVIIKVEVDVASRGFPKFNIVGLASKSVEEAKERVRTGIINSGFEMPDTRITVNLAPADIPKNGSHLDLPIAVGILAASGAINRESLNEKIFVGELSLTGQVRKTPGVLPIADLARNKNIGGLFLAREALTEASLVSGIGIYPADSLKDLAMHLNGINIIKPFCGIFPGHCATAEYRFLFEDIRGQEIAKRAMEIAAAGRHNIHLKGPPGAGKTMLSRSFPSILPEMNRNEIIEVTKIYSIAGLLKDKPFIVARPFRSPHHTVSRIGLVGGGSTPMPGEISLSHRGVLFLDEFPEFAHSAIESLRAPMEDGLISIARASGTLTFPCRFIMLAASNPCPCGYLGHPLKPCRCNPGAIFKYKKKVSGPIMDRIDINIDVPPVSREKLTEVQKSETSASVRKRVVSAYERQKKRFSDSQTSVNAEMTSQEVKRFCHLSSNADALLKSAIDKLALSARSYFKTIKIAMTIADLKGEESIDGDCIAEALQYRAADN